MQKSSIIKNSAVIMILMIVSKITGFFRDMLVASAYGTTYQTDAYNISLTIPTLAFALIGQAVPTVFIPMFSKMLKERGRDEMYNFANKVLIILFSIILIIYLIVLFELKNIVAILAPNFNEVTTDLTIRLAKISIVSLMFLAIYSVFSAILQTLREFLSVTLVGIVINVPIIIYILGGNNFGIIGLTVVSLIGYVLQVLIQIPCLIKNKYKFKIVLNFKDNRFKNISGLLFPVVIGVGINQINTFVDQVIASGLGEGIISAVNLSSKVTTTVYGIYAAAIVTAIYPVLASEVDEIKKFKNHVSKGICNIVLMMLPSAIGIMLLSTEIVKVMFQRGVFDENSVVMTSTSVFFLAIGVTFYGVRDVLSKAFYSLQDTMTPMKNGAIGVVVNIVLDIYLSKSMGIGGLSLATSVSVIVTTILLYINLKRKLNGIFEKKFIIDLIKILFSAFVMGAVVYLINKFKIDSSGNYLLLELILVIMLACLIYLGMLKLLKIDIVEENLKIANKKVKAIIDSRKRRNDKSFKDVCTFENKNK